MFIIRVYKIAKTINLPLDFTVIITVKQMNTTKTSKYDYFEFLTLFLVIQIFYLKKEDEATNEEIWKGGNPYSY